MASRSSRQKNGLSDLADEVRRLLQEGGMIAKPTERVMKAARALEDRGIIQATSREYVRCADPQDRDFPPRNRNCRGRVYIHVGLDEEGSDYRCPDCERAVYPIKFGKRRHLELQVGIRTDGVTQFLTGELERIKIDFNDAGHGLLRIPHGRRDVFLCVIDHCTDEQCLTRDWAQSQPTVYIGINHKAMTDRFLEEEWLVRVCLGDLLCGVQDLGELIKKTAEAGPPAQVKNVSVPVFTKGPAPVAVEPVEAIHKDRQFVVQVGEKTVRVEGEEVIAAQAGPRLLIFKLLWNSFLEDVREGTPPEDFRALNITEITKALEADKGEPIDDETTVRRTVNRIQEDLEKAVKKKTGLPIDREDIVQTCRWQGQSSESFGYRINPFTVAARPFLG